MKKLKIISLISICLFSMSVTEGCKPKCKDGDKKCAPDEVSKNDLVITIVDNKSQQPLADIGASLLQNGNTVKGIQKSDSSGKIIFKDVPDGDGYQALITNAKGYKSTASQEMVVPGNPDNAILLDKIGNGEGSGLIAGSFKDRETKVGIQGMSVNITCVNPKYNKTISTDERGVFRAEGLLAGKYTIVARKAGYEPYQKGYNLQDAQALTIETQFLKKAGTSAASVGNYLVSLNGSKKVSEIKSTGETVWSFSTTGSIESATRTATGETLVSDGSSSKVVQGGITTNSFFFSGLKFPVWIDSLDGTSFLVTDGLADKIIEFQHNSPVWSFSNGISRPRSSSYLNNGNILIADTGNKRIVEVSRDGKIVWTFNKDLDKPTHALRLTNGNTLITDSGFSRVLEVNYENKVVWWYAGPKGDTNKPKNADKDSSAKAASLKDSKLKSIFSKDQYEILDKDQEPEENPNLLFPRSAIKLYNGNVLIADTGNNRIIEVSKDKKIVNEIKNLSRPVSVELL
ncbi:MAG: carboxypeptidase regulatory-like domain-containing protein [Candidatus Sericytochromatia bacterium]